MRQNCLELAIEYLKYEYDMPVVHITGPYLECHGTMFYLMGARLYKLSPVDYPETPLTISLEKIFT